MLRLGGYRGSGHAAPLDAWEGQEGVATAFGRYLLRLSAESGCAWSTPDNSGHRARHRVAMTGKLVTRWALHNALSACCSWQR